MRALIVVAACGFLAVTAACRQELPVKADGEGEGNGEGEGEGEGDFGCPVCNSGAI